jgi:RNA polymerase sigma factor (sigma-70 family)
MATGQVRSLLRQIRRAIDPRQGGVPDTELLERFVAQRDEAAFEVLLWRHGPMVLNVCRRLLHQEQDAEDAFQATFLTLVRKARSIGHGEAVASWLYKVAYRIALAARTRRALPVNRAWPMLEPQVLEATPDIVWRELRLVLDEEVSRLPAKYRTAFVLCYLEGRTNEEAAQELGCPKGTILSRLARARERLRRRLLQRGVALSTGALACVLAEKASAGALPTALVDGTLKVALLMAAGKATAEVISPSTTLLMEGAVRAMLMTKLRLAGLVIVALGLLGSGAGVLAHWAGTPLIPALAQAPGDDDDRSNPARDFTPPSQRRADNRRLASARIKSMNNLKQIALAMHNYHDTYAHFPPPAVYGKDGKALLSWRVLLLPYLEENDLYRQFKLDEPWDGPHNRTLLKRMPKVYAPVGTAAARPDSTFYQVFVGADERRQGGEGGAGAGNNKPREVGDARLGAGGGGSGGLPGGAGIAVPMGGAAAAGNAGSGVGPFFVKHRATRLADITDGTSNTVMVIEGGSAVPWSKPADLPYAQDDPLPQLGGQFPDLILAAYGDGSVRALRKDYDETMMRASITRNGGEVIDARKLDPVAKPGSGRGGELSEENQRLKDELRQATEELDILRAELELAKRKARLKHHENSEDGESSGLRSENARLTDALERTREEMARVQAAIDELRGNAPRQPTRRRDR